MYLPWIMYILYSHKYNQTHALSRTKGQSSANFWNWLLKKFVHHTVNQGRSCCKLRGIKERPRIVKRIPVDASVLQWGQISYIYLTMFNPDSAFVIVYFSPNDSTKPTSTFVFLIFLKKTIGLGFFVCINPVPLWRKETIKNYVKIKICIYGGASKKLPINIVQSVLKRSRYKRKIKRHFRLMYLLSSF